MSSDVQAPIYTDFTGLDALRRKAQQQPKAALVEVARQFESLFTDMMLKSMRDASFGDGLLDSQAGDEYRSLLDHQFALDFSQGHGLGLADLIVRQLGGSAATPAAASQQQASAASAAMPAATSQSTTGQAAAVQPTAVQPTAATFDSPQAFVEAMWPHARKAAAQIGVDPSVLIAQSALETGWGNAITQDGQGHSSHNLFNIKADGRWQGPVVSKATLEYSGGVATRQSATFRSYSSFAESFNDFVAFLRSSPRYAGALQQVGDPKAFLNALQQAGYATDPEYARKVAEILDRPALQGVAGQFKAAAAQPLTPSQES